MFGAAFFGSAYFGGFLPNITPTVSKKTFGIVTTLEVAKKVTVSLLANLEETKIPTVPIQTNLQLYTAPVYETRMRTRNQNEVLIIRLKKS